MEPGPGDLNRLIDAALAEIDQARERMTEGGKIGGESKGPVNLPDPIKGASDARDAAGKAGDRLRLERALSDYRATILNELV